MARRPLAWAALCVLTGWAQAQTAPADIAPPPQSAPALTLRASERLNEQAPRLPANATASFVQGQRIQGRMGLETLIEGDAQLRRPDLVLKADALRHDETSAIVEATGGLRLNVRGDRYGGSQGRMQMDAMEGFVLQPSYRFLANGGHGQAARVDFLDESRSVTWQGNYTTCSVDDGALPGWLLRADRLDIDQETGTGRAVGAVLELEGVPLLPLPSIRFPLDGRRTSGWLPPTVGLDNNSGLNLLQPYYWNIAPNRDATFAPHVMLRRGLDMGGEFRYLEERYRGQLSAHYMPNDRLRQRDRWGFSARHSGTIDAPLPGMNPLGLNIQLNRVSDDNHWRDFDRRGQTFTSRLLPNEGSLDWAHGPFSLVARASQWQTLQPDDVSLIIPPYNRLPQITGRYARNGHGGLDYFLEADYTHFRGDRALTGQPDAQRAYLHGQVARPFVRPWGFLTPRLQWHATHYSFDQPLGHGVRSASRSVPTFSLDSGLALERSARHFGRAFTQTLEPRLMYVYTPYRDQSLLPNYDSGAYDFNFATIWSENAFAGHDRVVDNNLITAGLTSRLLDAGTGAEAVRLSFAQRYRFDSQRVVLPGGVGADRGWSDMMLGAAVNISPRWSFDSVLHYNPDTHHTTRTTWQGRYTPGPYRSISLAYRYQRDLNNRYLDLGWQWPLNASARAHAARRDELGVTRRSGGRCNGRWYGVGRLNYSLAESRLVDGVLGLEYDTGCWIGRVVLEKTTNSSYSSTKRIMFQLELAGLSRVGSNPLATLRNHVPLYQPLQHSAPVPSRFADYD